MSDHEPSFPPSSIDDDLNKSKFTFRDLRHLSQSSVSCPLRVIALIDFDCFYAQCESVRLGLDQSVPLGVQQFDWVIALNYAARAKVLKRPVHVNEVKEQCPEIVLQHVATWREGDTTWSYRTDMTKHTNSDKAALDPYRIESRRAFNLVKSILPVQKIEKASVDEIFIDLSTHVHDVLLKGYPELLNHHDDADVPLPKPYTSLINWHTNHVLGETENDWDDIALSIGSEIIQDVRKAIYKELHYTTSAGIARNKVVAKLAAGHNKPNQQTVVTSSGVSDFLAGYKFTKIRGLGGKGGSKVEKTFQTNQVADLLPISIKEMRSKLGPDFGSWVYNVIRGIEYAEVVSRVQIQSMLSAKTFAPSMQDTTQAHQWLQIFIGDLLGRMAELDAESGPRRPKTMTLNIHTSGRLGPGKSRQAAIPSGIAINAQTLLDQAKSLLAEMSQEASIYPCVILSMGLSNFTESITENRLITSFMDTNSATRKRKRTDENTNGNAITSAGEAAITDNSEKLFAIEDRPAKSGEEFYSCPKCNKSIPADDVLEHLDWHVAIDLQNGASSQP